MCRLPRSGRVEWPLAVLAVTLCVCPSRAQPATAPGWDSLRALYDYDASAPLEAHEGPVAEAGPNLRQHVTFRSVNGETVPGLLLKPKGVEQPPCVFVLHGAGLSKDSFVPLFATFLCPRGYAVFGIDAALHGERPGAGRKTPASEVGAIVRAAHQTIVDCRRAFDYLQTRSDLDTGRVAYLGASMGAIFGAVVCGVDERFKCPILVVGGGDLPTLFSAVAHSRGESVPEPPGGLAALEAGLDPVNFVGHIAPRPVLMINGTQDEVIPRPCAEALHQAAQEPKEAVWLEANHLLFPQQVEAGQKMVSWLDAHLR